jgi:hypothetical protein
MKYLIRNTTLNKNLCLIIYKYIDYSEENLLKNLNKEQLDFCFILPISIIDIVLKSLRYGYKGFYVDEKNELFIRYCNDNKILECKTKDSQLFIGLKCLSDQKFNYCCINILNVHKINPDQKTNFLI